MTELTIHILDVEDGVNHEGSDCRYVVFKVLEWFIIDSIRIPIPLDYTEAQAKTAIDAYVTELANNLHEYSGLEWKIEV